MCERLDMAAVGRRGSAAISSRAACGTIRKRRLRRGSRSPMLVTILRLAVALECKVTDLVAVFDKADLPKILAKQTNDDRNDARPKGDSAPARKHLAAPRARRWRARSRPCWGGRVEEDDGRGSGHGRRRVRGLPYDHPQMAVLGMPSSDNGARTVTASCGMGRLLASSYPSDDHEERYQTGHSYHWAPSSSPYSKRR